MQNALCNRSIARYSEERSLQHTGTCKGSKGTRSPDLTCAELLHNNLR